jgi:raffinose/stachyose/melibiose transport system substrate-binding protein
MKSRHVLWNVLVVIVVCVTLVACAPPAAEPTAEPAVEPTEEPAEAPEGVIHYLTVQQEDEGWPLLLSQLTTECQAEHPGLSWEYEYVTQDDLSQHIQLLAGSDSLPELFNYESGAPLIDLVDSGQVVEVEELFTDLGIMDALNPAAVTLLKGLVNGIGLYALPMELNVEGFWYNKAIFDQYDLDVPTTWDEMLAVAETLNDADVQPFAVSGMQAWPITRLINGYVVRYYGYDAMARLIAGELSATDEGFVEAAQVIQDMALAGYFGPGVNTLDYGPAQDLFLQGEAAMFYMGSWALRDFNNPEVNLIGADNIGYFNIPVVEGGVGTMADYSINAGLTTSLGQTAYEENPEAVGAWLQCVMPKYGDQAMSELGLITGFAVSEVPDDVSALTQMTLAELAGAENGFPWFEAYFDSRTQDIATSNAQLLVTGDITPEDYMAEPQAAIDAQ